MLILGLTGSIGMGKSATAAMFREAGVPVFDADAAVHDLYREEAVAAIEAAFPGTAGPGGVDRARLRERVVGDDEAMARLEAIVHPMVQTRRRDFLARARAASRPVLVFDIPLLFETGGEARVDAVVLVSAPADVQRARVLERPGMNAEAFEAILARQMPDVDKRARSHFIIDTSRGFDYARAEVAGLLRCLAGAAGRAGREA